MPLKTISISTENPSQNLVDATESNPSTRADDRPTGRRLDRPGKAEIRFSIATLDIANRTAHVLIVLFLVVCVLVDAVEAVHGGALVAGRRLLAGHEVLETNRTTAGAHEFMVRTIF